MDKLDKKPSIMKLVYLIHPQIKNNEISPLFCGFAKLSRQLQDMAFHNNLNLGVFFVKENQNTQTATFGLSVFSATSNQTPHSETCTQS